MPAAQATSTCSRSWSSARGPPHRWLPARGLPPPGPQVRWLRSPLPARGDHRRRPQALIVIIGTCWPPADTPGSRRHYFTHPHGSRQERRRLVAKLEAQSWGHPRTLPSLKPRHTQFTNRPGSLRSPAGHAAVVTLIHVPAPSSCRNGGGFNYSPALGAGAQVIPIVPCTADATGPVIASTTDTEQAPFDGRAVAPRWNSRCVPAIGPVIGMFGLRPEAGSERGRRSWRSQLAKWVVNRFGPAAHCWVIGCSTTRHRPVLSEGAAPVPGSGRASSSSPQNGAHRIASAYRSAGLRAVTFMPPTHRVWRYRRLTRHAARRHQAVGRQ